MKPNSLLCLCLLWTFLIKAQINIGFIEHLRTSNLPVEYSAYLHSLEPAGNDSIHYQYARYYLRYFNDSAFMHHYSKAAELCERDTQLVAEAHMAFLNRSTPYAIRWFEQVEHRQGNARIAALDQVYRASLHPKNVQASLFPEQLQGSFRLYQKSYAKKPGVAMALSVLLPGSGKWYAGRGRSFLMSLGLNVAYGAQSYESYKRLGLTHPLTLVNLGAFSIFYLSSVYGSYRDVKQARKESKKQWISETLLYYH